MDIYSSDKFLEHYHFPRNTGKLKGATNRAEENNASCGDSTKVELIVNNNRLKIIRHNTTGCSVAIACASILSEKLTGEKTADILKMTGEDFIKLSGLKLTMGRIKCALLLPMAIKKALLQT